MLQVIKEQNEILRNAIEAFQKATGEKIEIAPREAKLVAGKPHQADAVIWLKELNKRYQVEIKNRLTNETIGTIIHKLNPNRGKEILVAPYVNPKMADRLKEMGIPFFDTAGNAYLHEPPALIFIKGNRLPEDQIKQPASRAFQAAGLKVLFTLICNPKMINAPYREIAKAADIALGNVGIVLHDLEKAGLLVDLKKKGRRLIEREKIIQRWVEHYPENLKPKLFLGKFRTGKFINDVDLVINHNKNNNFELFWGGELAAAQLTKYLRPEYFTAYIKGNPNWLILEKRMMRDPQGNLELLKTFWNFELNPQNHNLVPPLLIYADLLATGDNRNIETADLIYEKYLTRFIKADD